MSRNITSKQLQMDNLLTKLESTRGSHLFAVIGTICLCLVCNVLSCGRCMKKYDRDLGICHGSIDDLKPTGLFKDGVLGSEMSALADWEDLTRLRECYEQVASDNCLEVALIAAIASRESRGGRLLNATRGYSPDGQSYGIMQCDLRVSRAKCLECEWDSCCHVTMMVQKFIEVYFRGVQERYYDWSRHMQLQGAVAAYNLKSTKFRSPLQVDRYTTNKDYSNDVIARAQYLKRNGWENPLKIL